jgi:hypothetical protein
MACEDGTWIHVHCAQDGERLDVFKCNGCAAWWVIMGNTGADAYVIDSADGSEDAVRQALAERFARA